MKKKLKTKFSWCPVCMVHTYHKRKGRKWICTDWNHEDFLRLRTDPWIKEYREQQKTIRLAAAREA